jgi:serine kinase of HPr protein (carbohydrate metabolism regulator)
VIRHAGLIARRLGGVWKGALIEGPSGSGKSDLALRCLDLGFRLAADDRVELWASGGRLYGCAPRSLAGLIEVRGEGIGAAPALPFAEVALVVQAGQPERAPDPDTTEIAGIVLPRLTFSLLEASAAAKLSRALARFDGDPNRRM